MRDKKSQREEAANGISSALKKEHGYCYFKKCVENLPCIDWMGLAAKFHRIKGRYRTVMISSTAMWRLYESYEGNLAAALEEMIEKKDVRAAVKLIDDFVGYCDSKDSGDTADG